jgi:hypothetical protein
VALFSRRIPFLQDLFPSSGRDVPVPNEVSDIVHLVHPWPGRSRGLFESATIQASSASAVTPVLNVNLAAPNQYIEVVYMDVSHDSATARAITMFLRDPRTGAAILTAIARWAGMTSVLTAGVAGGFQPVIVGSVANGQSDALTPPRPLIVPPGCELQLNGDTAAAAYAITVSMVRIFHPLHEEPALP